MSAKRGCPFRCGWESDAADDTAACESLCLHLKAEHGAHEERRLVALDPQPRRAQPLAGLHSAAGGPRRTGLAAYFVHYHGELTEDARLALDRPGFAVCDDGAGAAPHDGRRLDQVVRVNAHSPDEAEQLVVEALGRRPDRVHVR